MLRKLATAKILLSGRGLIVVILSIWTTNATRDGNLELNSRSVLYLIRVEHLQLLEILLSCRAIAFHAKCLSLWTAFEEHIILSMYISCID